MSKHRKSYLKELADKGEVSPAVFTTSREGGTDHQPGWVAKVVCNGVEASGVGDTKSEAEDSAAGAVLQKLGK